MGIYLHSQCHGNISNLNTEANLNYLYYMASENHKFIARKYGIVKYEQ